MKNAYRLIYAVSFALLTGCATKPPVKVNYIFFPPAPDDPHVQFLTGIGQNTDLGGASSFAEFIVGAGGGHTIRPIMKPYGLTAGKGKIYVCDTQLSLIDE